MIHDLHTLHRGLKWYHKYVFIPALVRPITREEMSQSLLQSGACHVWPEKRLMWRWENWLSVVCVVMTQYAIKHWKLLWLFCGLHQLILPAPTNWLSSFLSLSLSLSSHLVSKVRYEVRRQVCRVIDPGQTGVMEREEDLQRSECDVIQHPTDCLSDVRRKWGKVSDLCMV